MPRYIDADKALSFPLANGEYDHKNANEHFIYGCETYREWLEQLPTVSPDEVRGKGEWIKAHDDTAWWWECSVCHEPPLQRYKCDRLSNFCPNCGAKMEVER